GGSIRLPAAACGGVGFKPALGAVSTEGVFPLAASFDTVGPMARTVAECALAYAILTRPQAPRPRLRGLRGGGLTALPRLWPRALPGPAAGRRAGGARRARAGRRAAAAGARRRRRRGAPAGARGRHLGRLLRRRRGRPRGDLPEPARRVRAADHRQARARADR